MIFDKVQKLRELKSFEIIKRQIRLKYCIKHIIHMKIKLILFSIQEIFNAKTKWFSNFSKLSLFSISNYQHQ